MLVKLGNKVLLNFSKCVYNIQTYNQVIHIPKGPIDLQFIGTGHSNGFGMTLAKVHLYLIKIEKPLPLSLPAGKDFIINGQFKK